ncbi:DNA end-binding protein Ku [Desulfotomaculum arcticum]|uniref:Non-homologous end joining protein Ku n=1 Tax=Desulfotruncus arcticus DSM 17038 TaxID=1121424 RepID=A0A1I2MSX0_9FIRM|nr:Ku protein [Desulfotruncus arcticus]SFF92181.1 DNA end-binding protein Ku [Desulfotomaculum arcticum] [Desulfotruncus arcticus DSM 17038]
MRAIWKGSISFGLVNIPVSVCGAVETKQVSFNQIHEPCKSRIKYQKYCPCCDKEVPAEEIIKGYQTFDGMITVTQEDLTSIPLPSLKTLELDGFIKEKKVDPMFYQKPYYLLPNKSDEAYWLLYHALKKSGKVAIARFAVHSREHLALIRPANNVLTLCTLYYPEEIREVKEVPMKPDAKHLDMAINLIEQQTIDFNPENYKDRYQEALVEMLSKKQPEIVKRDEPQQVTDLMETLKKSIEKAKEKQKSA